MNTTDTVYLTSELPGIGGVIKERPEDFIVEEQPLYQPVGEGEHCYLFIEKTGIGTPEMVEIVAKHFGVRDRDVGVAGQKDAHAVTRQLVSVHTPGKTVESFPMLEHPSMGVLWVDMHTNKLRMGHLAGNRFSIKVRGVEMTIAPAALAVVKQLETQGVPNRFGPQRFGNRGDNHVLGKALLLGESRKKFGISRRRLFLNSLQSALFNEVLDRRIADGALGSLTEGDLAWKHDSGSVFAVDADVLAHADTSERLASLAISPSGPMWGAKMSRAAGTTDETELLALAKFELTLDDFANSHHAKLVPGVRRPLRVAITDCQVEGGIDEHGGHVRLAFDLPPGTFATAVLREIMKSDDL
ncbi:MAG: tRNA pseudouridine(13) synthase TruD [Phycisphaera sp.]|nr:MAG: tRNA pseudouridine(13) synthase TruD [Phycisphaera sp.]